ncbi:hypothetical protein [Mesoflavibacter sp. CH_XMU1422-2]
MKTSTVIRRLNQNTLSNVHCSREIFRFSCTENGLWRGVKRYAH